MTDPQPPRDLRPGRWTLILAPHAGMLTDDEVEELAADIRKMVEQNQPPAPPPPTPPPASER